ncbi:uncharacterized protein C11orf98 [Lingula anatina]|uniref:Uncharacterized protein C11orf98 n=1 Tax=Lingula anatina TaxID=7574 RepID=A0A1S3IN49_LINAN|nr:uncharacterized protein C11orf98 [Lingula anatina]|eukprot:XP_013399665.1 uncharacterized protein C11orf98 [Lingula anatina]
MGVHGMISNRKRRHNKQKKAYRRQRIKTAAQKEKSKIFSEIPDPELITIHHLRKRKTSSRANIELSGKKKRKLLKQLRHMQKDQTALNDLVEEVSTNGALKDIEMKSPDPQSEGTQKKDKKSRSKKSSTEVNDTAEKMDTV